MKILKFQKIFFLFVLLAGGAPAVAAPPNLAEFDLDEIQTRSGTVYREIELLSSDAHGLLFRHASGIAKLPFAELPAPLDAVAGNDVEALADGRASAEDELAGLPGEGFPGAHGNPVPNDSGKEAALASPSDSPVFQLTVRSRIRIPLVSAPGPHWGQSPWPLATSYCPSHRPSHWPQRPPPHFTGFYPSPPCREAALRNLLITSGLAHPGASR